MKKSEIISQQKELIALMDESMNLAVLEPNTTKKMLKLLELQIRIYNLKKRLKLVC